MIIEIKEQNGKYVWDLYDGPDGIDHREGKEKTLGEVFQKIIEYRMVIAKEYE